MKVSIRSTLTWPYTIAGFPPSCPIKTSVSIHPVLLNAVPSPSRPDATGNLKYQTSSCEAPRLRSCERNTVIAMWLLCRQHWSRSSERRTENIKKADTRTQKGTAVSIRHCLVAGAIGKRYGVNRSAAITVKLPCLRLWP